LSKMEIKEFKPQSFGASTGFKRHSSATADEGAGNAQAPGNNGGKFTSNRAAPDFGAANSKFKLNPEVKKHLGLDAAERDEVESQVATEVEARMAEMREEAYAEGFKQGEVDGRTKAEADFALEMAPVLEQFNALLTNLDGMKDEFYAANESALVQLIFHVSKQVLLRELTTDREYVKRLTSQLVEKVGTKESIRLKISRADFANAEHLRDFLKSSFPELKNIQIDASEDLEHGGCKIETDLTRVNASVDVQLASIEQSLQGV
jgi:flagellar assembly protein FliH